MLQAWLKPPRGDPGDAGVLRVQDSRDELERAEEEKRRRQLTQRVQTAINARAGEDLFLNCKGGCPYFVTAQISLVFYPCFLSCAYINTIIVSSSLQLYSLTFSLPFYHINFSNFFLTSSNSPELEYQLQLVAHVISLPMLLSSVKCSLRN